MKSSARLITVGMTAALLAFADDKIKKCIEDGSINNDVIKPNRFFRIEKYHNSGFAGSRLENKQEVVAAVSSSTALFQAYAAGHVALNNSSFVYNAANTLILAGALSNTGDRIRRRYVVDYLRIKNRIYNLSDFYIFAGVLLSMAYIFGRALDE